MSQVECVWNAKAVLGEGPIWDEEAGAVYWLDILGPAVHCFEHASEERKSWPIEEPIGFIAERTRGGFVAGLKSGLAVLDLDGPILRKIGDPEPDWPDNRFNDGKCDDLGRLWAGTMDMNEEEPTGWLYRVDPDGTWTKTDGPYIVTNGPALSPDGSVLYHTDSVGRTVYAFDLTDDGVLLKKRVFARFGESDGCPDGMTTDAEGYVWIAMWGGWCVNRFSPDGKLDRSVRLPVSQVTSCVFAGLDFSTLYLTSASIGLSEEQQVEEPLAGGLFRIQTDVQGLPTKRFAG